MRQSAFPVLKVYSKIGPVYINPFSKTSFFVLTNILTSTLALLRCFLPSSTLQSSPQGAYKAIYYFSFVSYSWTCEFLGVLALIALAILSSISDNFKLEHVNVEFLRSLHL